MLSKLPTKLLRISTLETPKENVCLSVVRTTEDVTCEIDDFKFIYQWSLKTGGKMSNFI